jgi:hypothetical protein
MRRQKTLWLISSIKRFLLAISSRNWTCAVKTPHAQTKNALAHLLHQALSARHILPQLDLCS